MAIDFPEHPFWDFSLKLYREKAVAPACLALQNDYAADVNILLYCCWLGVAGAGRLSEADMRRVVAAVDAWQSDMIRPLRRLRQRLKQGFEPVPEDTCQRLRQAIQLLEIDAEHVEQLLLAELAPVCFVDERAAGDRARVAAANLVVYLTVLGVVRNNDVDKHLSVMLNACFSDLDASAALAGLSDET